MIAQLAKHISKGHGQHTTDKGYYSFHVKGSNRQIHFICTNSMQDEKVEKYSN